MYALIDGDVLEYEAGFAAQKTRYYLDGQWFEDHDAFLQFYEDNELDPKEMKAQGRVESEIEVFPESVAINTARYKLSAILEEVRADDWIVAFSGSENFRDSVAITKKYKGNRDDAVKPHHFQVVRDWLRSGPMTEGHVTVTDGIEADDELSIQQNYKEGSAVICSIDKDLCQIPGYHYNWKKGIKFKVSQHDGLWFFMLQLLMGDNTDNIPGVPRIGEVKARKILEPYRGHGIGGLQQCWAGVLSHYENSKGQEYEGYLTEQGRLLWMLRHYDETWIPSLMEKAIDRSR